MPGLVITSPGAYSQTGQGFHLRRMITCPGHYLIPPHIDVFKKEPVSLLKNLSNWIEYKGVKINIKKLRIVKDKFGRRVIDWKKLYELRRKGIVLNPQVSAAWAIENIYDPKSFLCIHCDKRCKEGLGNIVTSSINRLNGKPRRS